MSFPKPKTPLTPAKGRVKCFKCRNITMAKDGAWQQADEMIFLCRPCETVYRAANAPAPKGTTFGGS